MKQYFADMLTPQEKALIKRLDTMMELELYCLSHFSNRIAFSTPERELTYRDFFQEVSAMRGGLQLAGLTTGQVVGIALPGGLHSLEAYLAVITQGGVAAMLPPTLPAQALNGLSAMIGASLIITKREDLSLKAVAPETLLHGQPTPAATVEADAPATAFLTGGTSGKPKAALLSHRALMTGVYNGVFTPGGSFYQRYLTLLPYYHVFGMIRSSLSCLQSGSIQRVCPELPAMIREIQAFRPTVLVLVPAMAEVLMQVLQAGGKDALGGNLRTLIVGGAPMRQSLAEEFRAYGIHLCFGYGLTETANLVSGNVDLISKPGSIGPAYDYQEVRIQDGEIQVKGDNIFIGYLNDPQGTAEAFVDGWFRTGDLGRFDDQGFLYLTGRLKNIIVLSSGEKISPEHLESLVDNLPGVRASLVDMRQNALGVEVLTCEVYPRDGVDEEVILQGIREINHHQLPDARIQQTLFRTSDFKRTPAMKILRNQA